MDSRCWTILKGCSDSAAIYRGRTGAYSFFQSRRELAETDLLGYLDLALDARNQMVVLRTPEGRYTKQLQSLVGWLGWRSGRSSLYMGLCPVGCRGGGLKQDLQDLGWQVQAVDMLGHGSRHTADAASLTIDDLARDVLAQVPEPVDILVGHSLGAIVALTLARLEPGTAAALSSRTPWPCGVA